MTQTTDYEREALNQLESADNFRKILAVIYEDKPLDYAMVGALKAGIRYSLDAAQTYATLAAVQADRDRYAELSDRARQLPSYGGGH